MHKLLILLVILTSCAEGARQAPDRVPPDENGKSDARLSRGDWVVAQIRAWNAGLTGDDRNEKYGEMAASTRAFFRGTNHLFWADHVRDRRLTQFGGADTVTFVQGDLHPENLGAYDVDGEVAYDVNDLDDALLWDYQLDLWRLATGIALVAEEHGLDADAAVDELTTAYLDALDDYVGNGGEKHVAWTADGTEGALHDFLKDVEKKESRAELLAKWSVVVGGTRRLDPANEDLAPAAAADEEELRAALPDVKSVARRLHAGVASLGRPRFYVLVEGPTAALGDDVILDVKLQPGPTGYSFIGAAGRADYRAKFANHAERAAVAGLALRWDADDDGEWLSLGSGVYTVRPLSPWKKTLDPADIDHQDNLEDLARAWGAIVATDHARADEDFDSEWVPGSFERAVTDRVKGHRKEFRALVREVAEEDAAQVAADYRTFLRRLAP